MESNEKRGFAAAQYIVLSTCHNPRVRLWRWLQLNEGDHYLMSPQEHLVELKAQHRALEQEIADALMHPSTDDTKIAELKRRKLQVKDRIARMQDSTSIH